MQVIDLNTGYMCVLLPVFYAFNSTSYYDTLCPACSFDACNTDGRFVHDQLACAHATDGAQ